MSGLGNIFVDKPLVTHDDMDASVDFFLKMKIDRILSGRETLNDKNKKRLLSQWVDLNIFWPECHKTTLQLNENKMWLAFTEIKQEEKNYQKLQLAKNDDWKMCFGHYNGETTTIIEDSNTLIWKLTNVEVRQVDGKKNKFKKLELTIEDDSTFYFDITWEKIRRGLINRLINIETFWEIKLVLRTELIRWRKEQWIDVFNNDVKVDKKYWQEEQTPYVKTITNAKWEFEKTDYSLFDDLLEEELLKVNDRLWKIKEETTVF